MSILIKGMEMPKVPGVYSLDLYVEEICQVQNLDGAAFEAIEIPPHGRLIDADVLRDECSTDNKPKEDWEYPWYEAQNMIDNAPTVIEAEEDE